ncbi:MAG: hemerythrin domain-containing protein [Halanaerobiales bacterium]
MDSIELMVEEHRNIKRVLMVIRKLALKILDIGEVDSEAYYKIIDFVRNYADKHHHSKEEDILFKKMIEELGTDVEEGPIANMLNEHQMGRMFMQKLENALEEYKQQGSEGAKIDIIANSVAYADMLYHHIDKEDEAVYVYGKANLSKEGMEAVKKEVQNVEKSAAKNGVQDKYIAIVEELELRVK